MIGIPLGLLYSNFGEWLLHKYVLKNPQLQLEEVVFVARMATAAPESLVFIAGRREWAERPEVAIALVRNPKTPVPLAIKPSRFATVIPESSAPTTPRSPWSVPTRCSPSTPLSPCRRFSGHPYTAPPSFPV